MATEGEIKPDRIRNPETHHEARTFNTRGVLLFLAFMVVFALFINFAVLGLMNLFRRSAPLMRTAENPIMAAPPATSPPPPVLQPDPVADLHQMRAQEDQILQGYAWIDRGAGKVRIPIARAMQLLVERGLPNASGPAPTATASAQPASAKSAAGAGK